jgi:hypothetical protein
MYTYYFDHAQAYYNRHEKRLVNQDGTPAPSMLITRYTSGYHWQTRDVKGPRGGKARKQRKANIFYYEGVFYNAKNVILEDGQKLNSYEPYEGTITDAYTVASKKQGVIVASNEIIEGVPVSAKDAEGRELWAWGINSIAELEDLMHIPEQDRAPQEPQELDEQEQEQAFEAERVAYLESTTEEGQQLDLVAYFGYGDATWQDLAKPAA